MNKKVCFLFVFLAGFFWSQAQGPVRERIKTLKVAFITERVGLTSKEAQQFWPIYNEHEEQLEAIRRKERAEFGSRASSPEALSDSEASDLLDELLTLETEKHGTNQNFIARIRKVIPPRKVLLLIKAEEDFKKRLLQQFRKRRQGR
ncbi:hypothetical protein GTQ34_01570 [Muricauda sp. JGD-17]|uniref:Sensor of ECF-type sigma factor n=1 Tax=Flagellimonas ochracea TaxID=2696472 RepID=A0A964WWH2_9FLAO|nr:hypothetical protein [Allomuricauda ochracea]NAY90594.1 hypothetical protein [Allomuricauda ochracea]